MPIQRICLLLAGLGGATATLLGAYGAHGLVSQGASPAQISAFNTAVLYQFIHVLALLALGLAPRWRPLFSVSAGLFVLGLLGFCASIYAKVLLGTMLGHLITPAGGICFMLGWAALCGAARPFGGKNE
ncbi:MAG: DUF423 domain-containing protein [Aeromonas sp.]